MHDTCARTRANGKSGQRLRAVMAGAVGDVMGWRWGGAGREREREVVMFTKSQNSLEGEDSSVKDSKTIPGPEPPTRERRERRLNKRVCVCGQDIAI